VKLKRQRRKKTRIVPSIVFSCSVASTVPMIACEKDSGSLGVAARCFDGKSPPCFSVADAGFRDSEPIDGVADIGFLGGDVAADAFGHDDGNFSVADAGFRDSEPIDGVAYLGFVMPEKKSKVG
jgi:hypothetical protein